MVEMERLVVIPGSERALSSENPEQIWRSLQPIITPNNLARFRIQRYDASARPHDRGVTDSKRRNLTEGVAFA
jgi:hypothetical protein